MKLTIILITICLLIAVGCVPQVKYQCTDGSFVDSEKDCPPPEDTALVTEPKAKTEVEAQIETNAKVESTIKAEVNTEVKQVFKFGDQITAGDFNWKFIKTSRAKEIGERFNGMLMGVEANGEFLIVDIEVENIGNGPQLLSDSFVRLVDEKGREFSPDTTAGIYLQQQSITFVTLNPGVTKQGKLVFDIPSDIKIANIKVSSSLAASSFYTVEMMI